MDFQQEAFCDLCVGTAASLQVLTLHDIGSHARGGRFGVLMSITFRTRQNGFPLKDKLDDDSLMQITHRSRFSLQVLKHLILHEYRH